MFLQMQILIFIPSNLAEATKGDELKYTLRFSHFLFLTFDMLLRHEILSIGLIWFLMNVVSCYQLKKNIL